MTFDRHPERRRVYRVVRLLLTLGLGAATAPALADETLYEQDGTKVTGAFTGALGVFAVGNTDFGAGNVNTAAPVTGPFSPSQRRTDREWVEGAVKPSIAGQTSLWNYGTGYTSFSFVAQGTRGNGDALSSLAPSGVRSATGDAPTRIDLEDALVGWRSGEVLKDMLGADGLDISYGNQSLLVGDGLVIGSGIYNAFGRGAFYTGLYNDFERTAIVRLAPDGVPLRGNVFKLEDRSDQNLMHGYDQVKAKLAGFNADLFKAGKATEGSDGPPPDVWTLGVLYFNIYDADSGTNNTGAHSFPSSGPVTPLAADGARDGLNVFSFRAAGSFFEFDRDILFYGEYVGQKNGAPNRNVDANAWYVEPGYRFSGLPWTPEAHLRYAHFSGDSSPTDRVKRNYDPLFFTAGPRGYGSWYMGEIYGWYLGGNTNIDAAMASLKVSPLDTLDLGALVYDFRFDQVRQFNDPRITSDRALDELDLYATWKPNKWFNLSGVVGIGVPGKGFKQAARAFVSDNGPPLRSVGSTMTLGELVATVQF